MFCVKCGKKFEGEGYICPECAAKGAAPSPEVLAAVGAAAAAPIPEEAVVPPAAPAAAVEYTAPTAPQAPVYTAPVEEAPAYQAQDSSQPVPGFTLSTAENAVKKPGKKKKKGLFIGLGIAAVALIVGIVVVALNWNSWFGGEGGNRKPTGKIPDDPGEYFAYLHEPQMEGLTQDISKLYGIYMQGSKAAAGDAELKITFGDTMLNLMKTGMSQSGMDMELDWLKEIGLKLHWNAPDEDAAQVSMDLSLGKQKIAGLDAVLDAKNMVMYMAIPELNDAYLKVDMQAMMAQMGEAFPFEEMMAISAQLRKDMPSEKEVQKLLDGYVDIFFDYMTDVEKEKVTVQAGDAEQEVTALTVTLTEKQAAKLVKELLQYTKDNETARQIAKAYVDYTNACANLGIYDLPEMTMDDFDDFMDEGIDTMQQLADEAEAGNYLKLITYADGVDILGHNLVVNSDGENIELGYLALTKKDTIYFDAKFDNGYESVTITGEGKRSKGLLSGEYVVEADGEEVATLTLEGVDTETGYGVYRISVNTSALDDAAFTMAGNFSYEIEVRENKLTLSILMGKAKLITMDLKVSESKATKVTIPKNAVDATDEAELARWAQNMDLSKLLANLKKAGVPDTLIDALEQAIPAA